MALDPEKAHGASILALKACPRWFFPRCRPAPKLAQTVFGKQFKSPVGLAAGYDKDGEVVAPLFSLGFGFVEVGGVTLHPQSGNPRPRLFRLTEDRAVINRMGLNSEGAAMVGQRLAKLSSQDLPGPLVVNLGLNKNSHDPAADYGALAVCLAPLVDVLTINVSSPNTPGLRALQDPAKLLAIVDSVRTAARKSTSDPPPAVLIKIAPDLSEQDISDLAEFVLAQEIDGLVVSNTTVARPHALISAQKEEAGGLSGAPLFVSSTELLRSLYAQTEGRIPLIGVGGVSSGAQAYAKIRAGASLIQLYSALVYEGPALIKKITDDLAMRLEADGFESIAGAVGADHQEVSR